MATVTGIWTTAQTRIFFETPSLCAMFMLLTNYHSGLVTGDDCGGAKLLYFKTSPLFAISALTSGCSLIVGHY
jgi:hypothetical protein